MSFSTKIHFTKDLSIRSYISITFENHKRVKEYTGNKIGLNIKPNYAKTIKERNYLLRQLERAFIKAIEEKKYPSVSLETKVLSSKTADALQRALNQKKASGISKYYVRNLQLVHDAFINFLTEEEKQSDITHLKRHRIQEFLTRFHSTGTYYMNKRRDLGVLFSQIGKELSINLPIVRTTDRRRVKSKLHKIYSKEQLKAILDFLKDFHYNLYLCCLFSYGCFLRPHREVRNLCGHHFRNDCTEIYLSGDENKGGQVRVVAIPDYIKEVIYDRVSKLSPSFNLFSLSETPFNDAYFNTAWTRAWTKMYEIGIIEQHQTIYSFRHSAAVDVYQRTKDLHLLQQLLGHSDMIVTLKYLRGLGVHNVSELKNVMPKIF